MSNERLESLFLHLETNLAAQESFADDQDRRLDALRGLGPNVWEALRPQREKHARVYRTIRASIATVRQHMRNPARKPTVDAALQQIDAALAETEEIQAFMLLWSREIERLDRHEGLEPPGAEDEWDQPGEEEQDETP